MTSLILNSLVYDRSIFRYSSKVFGNLWKSSVILKKFSENAFSDIRVTFEQVLENLRKSSEGGQKSLIKRQRRCHQYVNIIKKNITRYLDEDNISLVHSAHS